ncbi:ABC transporter permease [Pararhodobacter oceanensis]|uniref:ABC transporter permease n=1 Tax=Pararhodobacter oceanensis TaxID=2172121 RepID=UPI003A94B214
MDRLLVKMRGKPLGALGLLIVVLLVLVAVFAPLLAPYNPTDPDFMAMLQGPSDQYLLGTDELGRDMLSRLIWGARASLQAGLIAVILAAGIGVPIGLISGYFRGPLDEYVVMRLTDAMMAFPVIVLALALTAIMGPSLSTAMVAIGIVYAPIFIRLARAQTLSVRETEYVEAARALGNRHIGVMIKHVLPNIASPLIIQMSVSMATAILVESALSFLGLGVQPPTPSWGSMLRIGTNYMQEAPWIAFWPGLAIFVAVLGINLFGDALRDVLDPRDR